MKKIIAIIFIILSGSNCMYGQLMVNSNFSDNQHNDASWDEICSNNSQITGNTFRSGSVPNWYRTHGSPKFGQINTDEVNNITIESIGEYGEGLVGMYDFVPNQAYRINLGVRNGANLENHRIIIGQGSRPFNGDCHSVCFPPQWYHGESAVNNPSGGYNVDIKINSISTGNNVFPFVSPGYYNWIMILMEHDDDDEECLTSNMTITHLAVTRACVSDIWLNNTGILASGHYRHAKKINAGSSSLPATQSSGVTAFEASESILIDKNFIAAPGNGEYFLAYTWEYTCDNFPPSSLGIPPSISSSRTDKIANESSANNNASYLIGNEEVPTSLDKHLPIGTEFKNAYIFPNPASTVLNISGVSQADYTVQDILGRSILSGKIRDGYINLTSLSEGNYILSISAASGAKKHFRFTKK